MRFSKLRARGLSKQKNNLFLLGLTIVFAHCGFARSWSRLSTPADSRPIARSGAPGVYDSASNRMIVFGGRDSGGKNLNDVWVLANGNGLGGAAQWIELIPNGKAGSPPAAPDIRLCMTQRIIG